MSRRNRKLIALKLLLVAILLVTIVFSACHSEKVSPTKIVNSVMDGYSVELFEKIEVGKSAEEIQSFIDSKYNLYFESGKVVEPFLQSDIMLMWFEAYRNEATFSLKQIHTSPLNDNHYTFEVDLLVTSKNGDNATITLNGSLQLNENGKCNFMSINSLDEFVTFVNS